jgi:hypothetical protein
MNFKQEFEIGISNIVDRFTKPDFRKKIIWTFLSFGVMGISTTIFNFNTLELVAENNDASLKVVFSDDTGVYSFILSIISFISAIYFSVKLFKYEMLLTIQRNEYDKGKIKKLDDIASPDYLIDFFNHILANHTILDQSNDLDIIDDYCEELDSMNSELKNKRLEYLRIDFKAKISSLKEYVIANFFDYGMGNSLMLRPDNRRQRALYEEFTEQLISKLNDTKESYNVFRTKCNQVYLV